MGDGRELVRTAGDCGGRPGMGEDGGGRPGTTRVMSHGFSLAGPKVQALRLWSPIVRPVLTLPGVVRPSTPKKTDYEP